MCIRDSWYVGYTRDLSTAVWMGYRNGEIPMLDVHGEEVAGATFAVPIWHLFMEVAEHGLPPRLGHLIAGWLRIGPDLGQGLMPDPEMCIRDSVRAVAMRTTGRRRAPRSASCTTTAALVPVSYTHLDVYKRQVLGRARPTTNSKNSSISWWPIRYSTSPSGRT